MSLIHAYYGLGLTRNIVINDVEDNPITPNSSDKIRAIIKRDNQTAVLTVTSDAPTANGSSLTKGATNVLRLDGEDLKFPEGAYTLSFEFFDSSDSSEWKMVEKQVFALEGVA